MKKENIGRIMKALEEHYSHKKRTTLNRMRKRHSRKKPDAFKILISCLLSLRTRDENTEKVTKNLFLKVKTPEDIIKMPVKNLERLVYSSGHYRKKARTLKHVSKVILKEYWGRVPELKEELLSIKGIGPKTANVVLNFAFNKLVIPVDANVHRISNRLGWVSTKTPEKTEKALEKILPKKYWREINGLFILHGKNICLPISPFCSRCPIKNYCNKVNVLRSR